MSAYFNLLRAFPLFFSFFFYRVVRQLASKSDLETTGGLDLYDTLDDLQNMSVEELKLYKLYRPERTTPTQHSVEILKTPSLNKGMGFSLYERQYLGIHGLLPPAFMTQEQQAYRVMCKLREQPNDLARYVQLSSLQDRNEKLFYRVLCDNVKELMPIVYTPTVGLACQNFGYIYRSPKGIYVTINDNSISKIHQILCNWPEKDVRAIVVTDGERILGLGDLGTYGIGIPVGKLALYVALGGVQPKWCLPVLLDVGTDNEELLNDPFYIGLRHKRVRGEHYDELLENFMKACTKRYGQKTLIQFEDFGNQNAYRLLKRFQYKYTMFNDDIQGTASVVVAGLMACSRVTKKPLSQERLVFFGAGGAATGIAEMCVRQMLLEGLSEQEAAGQIYMMDIDGLITKSRASTARHSIFAKNMRETRSLIKVIENVKPGILIGASTARGAFTEEVIRTMAEINERPVIFALSNPTSKSECTAEEAFRYTDGRVLFASGSPFPNVELNGKVYEPGQGNNAYIFPGVALGTILFQVRHIDSTIFLLAAKEVASYVSEEDLAVGRIYPRLQDIRETSVRIAMAVADYAYKEGLAGLYPKPANLEKYIRAHQYKTEYDDLINAIYDWPREDTAAGFPILGVSSDDDGEVDMTT
ncbi:unnamed protein product [Enterobius vermicularis]|uniref:Malic enzyme n=1 Tax=Enterobius vermicularis TaxID=51028 RepID=A0A0N4V4B0_ENTVE|nr:unnamed protein product [Enterobius vermicularis]